MKEEVARLLLKVKAVTLNVAKPYTFASGIKSPIYCDNRLLLSHPEEREKVVAHYLQLLENLDFDIVAGTATAGIPWAAWIAATLGKPMIYVRAKPKDHGKENLVEGKLEKGKKAVIIEDLVSSGSSSIAAVEAVRNGGGIVEDCVAIFTYEMKKSAAEFAAAKCTLHTLTNFSTLMAVAEQKGYITAEEKEKALVWNKDPERWGREDKYL